MSMSIPFDTLDYARKLESVGTPNAQAELQSKLLAEVLGKSVSFPQDLVTLERNLGSRIDSVELKIGSNIQSLELKFESRISALEGRLNLNNWMLATMIAINVAVALKILH